MEISPFEDVYLYISYQKYGDFPAGLVAFAGGYLEKMLPSSFWGP